MADVTTFRQLSRLRGVSLILAGDAYYAPPGHLPLVTAGTTIVEFSPTADLEATMAVVQKNLTRSETRA